MRNPEYLFSGDPVIGVATGSGGGERDQAPSTDWISHGISADEK